ncbi:hypothetical protein K491DRAFT_690161 [Lophiostoma macrostomum CBS 122681]|uniref:Uncharacterized protein n=1 Tax=Lophiostoma macrostomum CBS 122681 TaxID=1314788 RepID=A0A6A6TGG2_9PLEO|nr:hypothetical protein K491DRAFT_690161 [Lophiostoma macrostomum CBS 122681]
MGRAALAARERSLGHRPSRIRNTAVQASHPETRLRPLLPDDMLQVPGGSQGPIYRKPEQGRKGHNISGRTFAERSDRVKYSERTSSPEPDLSDPRYRKSLRADFDMIQGDDQWSEALTTPKQEPIVRVHNIPKAPNHQSSLQLEDISSTKPDYFTHMHQDHDPIPEPPQGIYTHPFGHPTTSTLAIAEAERSTAWPQTRPYNPLRIVNRDSNLSALSTPACAPPTNKHNFDNFSMTSLVSQNAPSHVGFCPKRINEAFRVDPADVELQPLTKVDSVVEPYRGDDPIRRAWSQSKRAAKMGENLVRRGVADLLGPVWRWGNEAI